MSRRSRVALFGLCWLTACAGPEPRGAPPPGSIVLVYTADVHSHLEPEALTIRGVDAARGLGQEGETVPVGGAARIATVLDRARAGTPPAFYVDAGDLLEGTAFFPAFGGEPELRVALALGVDAVALGNHDSGFDGLAALVDRLGGFPFVAANLGDGPPAVAAKVRVLERGGARVAVIGLGARPDAAPDLAACAAAVQDAVTRVRADVDVVVVLSHLGREADLALVPRTFGVDLVIGGHTHDVLDPPLAVEDCDAGTRARYGCTPHTVPVVHPGAYGRFVGRAELQLSRDRADLGADALLRPAIVTAARFTLFPVESHVPERADIVALLEPYHAALEAAGVERAVAFAPEPIRRGTRADSSLGDLVADAVRADTGAGLAFVNTAGIRSDLLAGNIAPRDLALVLPFADTRVRLLLDGAELEAAVGRAVTPACRSGEGSPLQLSGGRLEVACSEGSVHLEIGGSPVAPGRSYRVVVASYLTEPGRVFDVPGSQGSGPSDPGDTVPGAFLRYLTAFAPCLESTLPCVLAPAPGRIRWR